MESQTGPAIGGDPLAPLVDGATAGNQAQLRGILDAVAPAVRRVVRAIMGAGHLEVADVVQEGLMDLPRALRSFRRESSVLQYARQVAARKAITARYRWRRRQRVLEGLRQATDPDAEIDPSDDPVVRHRRQSAFCALLNDLPDAQARTFVLRVLLDYPLPRVASATGVSINTVRSRVRLAREKLKMRIKNDPALYDTLRSGDI